MICALKEVLKKRGFAWAPSARFALEFVFVGDEYEGSSVIMLANFYSTQAWCIGCDTKDYEPPSETEEPCAKPFSCFAWLWPLWP